MAKKNNVSITEDIKPAYAIVKKHGSVRHNAPIKVSEYRGRDGVTRWFRFNESDKEFKEYGNTTYNVIVTNEGKYLDLSNPIENMQYSRLKEMERLNLHPFKASEPILVIQEPEREDDNAIKFFDRQYEALRILKEELSDPVAQREFAHYWGEHEGTANRVFLNLRERAEKKPDEFISAWNDPLRTVIVLVRKSIDNGLITLRGDTGVYFFGEEALGRNFEEVAQSFAKDAALTTILNKRIADSV